MAIETITYVTKTHTRSKNFIVRFAYCFLSLLSRPHNEKGASNSNSPRTTSISDKYLKNFDCFFPFTRLIRTTELVQCALKVGSKCIDLLTVCPPIDLLVSIASWACDVNNSSLNSKKTGLFTYLR